MEARLSPLSSRAKPRDLQFTHPPSNVNGSVSPLCHPERSGGTCCSPIHHQMLNGSASLPFVIPSEAEGSAVLLNRQQRQIKARLSPLSSRAKRRDLLFTHPPSNVNGSASLPFVIPSEAEGSAVHSTGIKCRSKRPALPLSSRAKRGTCCSPIHHQMLNGSASLPFVIPSAAEGSAVSLNRQQRQIKAPCSTFVIPTEA